MLRRIDNLTYFQKSAAAAFAFCALRLILSAFLELGTDESYYWTYARHLQWNYFDHPPVVAGWTVIFTGDLFFQSSFFLRLGSFAGCLMSSYFIYHTIAGLSNDRAGFIGVVLYNASFYAGITAGLMLSPDAPQMVFWTAAMYAVTMGVKDDRRWLPWLSFGIAAGICTMSKLHGIFLWSGMLLYAVLFRRSWLMKAQFYTALLITAVIISPILFWNIQNNFITYRFDSGRVILRQHNAFHLLGLTKEFIGEAVINNPFIVILSLLVLITKRKLLKSTAPLLIFGLMSFPLLFIIWFIASTRLALPHWSGPAYIALIPIAAIGLSQCTTARIKKTLKVTVLYTIACTAMIGLVINLYPGTFGDKTAITLGSGDVSLDSYGWKKAGIQFGKIYDLKFPGRSGAAAPPLVCYKWWGAHDEYFFARPLGLKMIGLGSVYELHNYAWESKFEMKDAKIDTAICIIQSDDFYDAKAMYTDYYSKIDSIAAIPVSRLGKPVRNFYVYELTGWRNNIPAVKW